MSKVISGMDPFPSLRFVDGCWEAAIELGAWRQFSHDSPSEVTLRVESVDEESMMPPTPAQQDAFRFLLENQDAIRGVMLDRLLEQYGKWRNAWGSQLDDAAESMPPVTHPDSFRDLISLNVVYVCAPEDDGKTQVGFDFRCSWDEEHGLGFMTLGTSDRKSVV